MKFSAIWMAPLVLVFGTSGWTNAATVENVRAQQRPRSNVVEVFYDLVAPEGGVYDVALAISGGGDTPTLSTLSGDIGADVIPGRNKKIEWDAGADWAQHVGSNLVATVTATKNDEDTGLSKGMVSIPGGTNSGVDPDFGAYTLTVESFYMDRTEVTYAHWKRVYDWALLHGYAFEHGGSGKGNNHPVHTVSFYDCAKWCNARSEMEGRTPAYRVNGEVYRTDRYDPQVDLDCNGYRLPTTTEWQYAARGGLHGKRFPWGDSISWSKANFVISDWDYVPYVEPQKNAYGYHPRFIDGARPYTAPVGSFAPNRYGLYDMAGNVEEWCTNASGAGGELRGGDWSNDYVSGRYCRIGYSYWTSPADAYDNYGFRAVRRR